MLTLDDITAGYENPEWGGFGYLGARCSALTSTDPDCPPVPDLVAEADAHLLAEANARGWTEADLFDWLDSKRGRWYGDVWFGGSTPEDRKRHLPDLI